VEFGARVQFPQPEYTARGLNTWALVDMDRLNDSEQIQQLRKLIEIEKEPLIPQCSRSSKRRLFLRVRDSHISHLDEYSDP
jgi:hypothetical protein